MKLHTFLGVAPVVLSSLTTEAATDSSPIVSLQWSICGSDPLGVLQKLGYSWGKTPFKRNPITYFDLADPVYTQQGIMFRRKVNHHVEVSSVKVRFNNETTNVPEIADCNWDRYGRRNFYTCERREFINGTSIWSDEQVAFIEHYRDDIVWDELVPYGPFWNTKWKVDIFPVERIRTVFDTVTVGSEELMEIELKVAKEIASCIYEAVTRHLKKMGILVCERQEPRTFRMFRALGYSVDGDGRPGVWTVQT